VANRLTKRRRREHRRAQLGESAPSKEISKRERVFRRSRHRCVYCQAAKELTLDHLQPRALGGSNNEGNLACACRRCNQERGTRNLQDWLSLCRLRGRVVTFTSASQLLEWARAATIQP